MRRGDCWGRKTKDELQVPAFWCFPFHLVVAVSFLFVSHTSIRRFSTPLQSCLESNIMATGGLKCYFPNGSLSPSVPCDPSANVTHCCLKREQCLTNGICAIDATINYGVQFARGVCSDPTWQSPVCPKVNEIHSRLLCAADYHACNALTSDSVRYAASTKTQPPTPLRTTSARMALVYTSATASDTDRKRSFAARARAKRQDVAGRQRLYLRCQQRHWVRLPSTRRPHQ